MSRERMADQYPDRIWLQAGGEYDGPTWCQDKINDDDIEYTRTEALRCPHTIDGCRCRKIEGFCVIDGENHYFARTSIWRNMESATLIIHAPRAAMFRDLDELIQGLSPELLELARRAAEAQANDTRTEAEIIADATAFVMGEAPREPGYGAAPLLSCGCERRHVVVTNGPAFCRNCGADIAPRATEDVREAVAKELWDIDEDDFPEEGSHKKETWPDAGSFRDEYLAKADRILAITQPSEATQDTRESDG